MSIDRSSAPRPLSLLDLAAQSDKEIWDFETKLVAAFIETGSHRKAAALLGTTTRHAVQIVRARTQTADISGLSTIADVDALIKEQFDHAEELGLGEFQSAEGYFHTQREAIKVMMRIAESGGDRQTDEWVLDGDLDSRDTNDDIEDGS